MRLAPFALCLLTFAATAQEAPADKPEGRKNQKIERIHVEDSGSKVDELRVGGQTQQIVVQPSSQVVIVITSALQTPDTPADVFVERNYFIGAVLKALGGQADVYR